MSVRSARYNLLSLRNPKGLTVIPEERDAWAFLDAAKITSSRQQRAVIELVRGLKHAQLWSKMKAIYPFVGGTATTHKFNLKDPRDADAAFRLSFSGGWTHSTSGAEPNGTNAYANTYLNPSTQLTTSSGAFGFYCNINSTPTNNDCEIGAANADVTQAILLYIRDLRSTQYRTVADIGANGTSTINEAQTSSEGFFLSKRTSSGDFKVYKNSTQIGSNTTTDPSAFPNFNIFVSAANYDGGPIQYSPKRTAFVTIGDGLTDTDATALYNIVQRFQTSLGRNV